MSAACVTNFLASIGCALALVVLLQQVSSDPVLSPWLTEAHRVVLVLMALGFFVNAFEDHGGWLKPLLASACCCYFILRAVARHRYPPRHL